MVIFTQVIHILLNTTSNIFIPILKKLTITINKKTND